MQMLLREQKKGHIEIGQLRTVGQAVPDHNKNNIIGDFKFVLSEKFLSNDSRLRWREKLIMNSYFLLKKLSLSEESAFGLDSSSVKIEKFPLVLHAPEKVNLTRLK